MELASCVVERSEGIEIRIYVQPRASKTEIIGLHGESLKIRIAAPPVDGQANAELCRYLARHIGVPQKDVQLKSGDSSRQKRVFIAGKTLADIRAALTKSPSTKNPEHP